MANSYFKFKQFVVNQQRAAMKVGTDGVLLGAWCRIEADQHRILDIGAGTGVISLMAAQRSNMFEPKPIIDALEIDNNSFLQGEENFEISMWSDRLRVINVSLQEYDSTTLYDHIITNPPYFNNSLQSPDRSRTTARHTCDLSYIELAQGVDRLLTSCGHCSLVIPCGELEQLVEMFNSVGLYVSRSTDVLPRADRPAKRVLLEFCRRSQPVQYDELVVESNHRGEYTDDYQSLTREFYLKF